MSNSILFIQTGGTIDKDYPKVTKGWAFDIAEPAVERILPKINPTFDYSIYSFLKKDSQEITDEDRIKLLNYCKSTPFNKIIITHGTDTMIETGLSLTPILNKTIVLTGAMRPERFQNTDADLNIGMALAGVQTCTTGVYIAMHGNIIPIQQAKRDLNSGQFIFK